MPKIAIAIEKPERTSPLSEVFGRSNYFLLLDTSNYLEEFLPNPFVSELGGAGIQTALFLINHNIDTIVAKKIGNNPLRFLISANMKVYLCKEENAAKTIQLFKEGGLKELKADEDFFSKRKRNRYGKKL